MKNKLLILDGNNIAFRAYHANSGLSYKGKSTAVIFGVLNILRGLVKNYKPKRVIIVWDGGRNPKRMETYPEYKGKRAANREKEGFDYEDWNRQREAVWALVRRLGIGQVWSRHMEADDYITLLVDKYYGKYDIHIVSNDKDFHQLVTDHVSQILIKDKIGEVVLGIKDFDETLKLLYPKLSFWPGITPNQHMEYLMLTGDDSDNIPGYGGLGDKKASDFLRTYDSIQNFLDKPNQRYIKGIRELDIVRMEETRKRNQLLIDLTFFKENFLRSTKISYIREERKGSINREKFIAIASKYNLRTFITKNFLTHFYE